MKNRGKVLSTKEILDLGREVIEEAISKIYLSPIQEKILTEKLNNDLTECGIGLRLGISTSTVYYQWKKVREKISKVV